MIEKLDLAGEVTVAISAGWVCIRVDTAEIADTTAVVAAVCERHGFLFSVWDKARGVHGGDVAIAATARPPADPLNSGGKTESGLAALRALVAAKIPPESRDGYAVLVAQNFHVCFAVSPELRETLIATVQQLAGTGGDQNKVLIVPMPAAAALPLEVEPLFKRLTHGMPDATELAEISARVVTEAETVADGEHRAAAQAALGLSRLQAEGVFGASLQRFGRRDPAYIWREKAEILNAEGLVTLHESPLRYAHIGGLDGLKDFVGRLLTPDPLEAEDPDARARGVIAVGMSGVGKSMIAYATGNEFGIPTVLVNVGRLMDQYVGNTEKNTRRLFEILARLAPCVCVLDEAGQLAGGDSNGVMNRMITSFLTAMNDMTENVFWFMTANDVENMHEALLRAERVDAKVYVRLPGVDQRAAVWKMYLEKFFPRTVGGKDDPRHVRLDADALLAGLAQSRKVDATDVGNRLAAALMAMPSAARARCLREIGEAHAGLRVAAEAALVDDEKWTPAEIRACCRLARKLRMPLHEAARRVGHVATGANGGRMLDRLDAWAEADGAIDSETGELFRAGAPAGESPGGAVRPRRRVRTARDSDAAE